MTHPINRQRLFLHPLNLGWLYGLFRPVQFGGSDGVPVLSLGLLRSWIPLRISEPCTAITGTRPGQLAQWWETRPIHAYCNGWLPRNTRHVCEAILDQPPMAQPPADRKCLCETRRDELSLAQNCAAEFRCVRKNKTNACCFTSLSFDMVVIQR